MRAWFKEWFNTTYYHQLYFKRNDEEAAHFIDNLVAHLQPAGDCKMLDVACGRGRHSIQLAGKGFDVTGIDLSEDSILEALKFEDERLHFFQHDMRLPFRVNYFDYAFNFFTSFGYFDTQRENDNAIRTISQALNAKGIFVLDYINVQYAEDHLIHQAEKEIEEVRYLITKWHDKDHFYKKIVIEDAELNEQLTFTEKVSKFTLQDFTEMFTRQGLQIMEVYGNYQFEPYSDKNSSRLILVAQKIARANQ